MRTPNPFTCISGKAHLVLMVLLLSFSAVHAQEATLHLTVLDSASQKPLPLAGAYVERYDLNFAADEKGLINISIPSLKGMTDIKVTITYVGKNTRNLLFALSPGTIITRKVFLADNNLYLDEVQVNAVRFPKGQSNSSIIIGRAAIESTFASSLDDVLRLLPGKTITNPSLATAKTLTLRESSRSNAFAANSAFGTAIIIDDNRLSNNANLQAVNPGFMSTGGGVNALTHRGDGGSSYANGASDVPGNGFDLRTIPVDNIESIEVISGIPSARYGDLTDGAVLVERKAGLTPLTLTARMRAGTTGLAASKGFARRGDRDVFNIGVEYTNENPDRRYKIKSYDRVGANLIWTALRGARKNIRNTLSLDLNSTLDRSRQDPDEANKRAARFEQRNIIFSNRINWTVSRRYWKGVKGSVGFQYGISNSYDQWWINRQIEPVSTNMEPGLHEGTFTHQQYMAVREIKGKPLSASGRLESEWMVQGNKFRQSIIAGGTINYDKNLGEGNIYDPTQPRFANQGFKNDRPEAFRDRPGMAQIGLYVEDHLRFDVFNKPMSVRAGLRYELQNGYNTLSPRINALYDLTPKISLAAAFGIAAKAPGLLHRYPGKVWFDFPLLVHFPPGRPPIETLFLVQTEMLNPDNSHLKPSKSSSLELGINYTSSFFRASLNIYRKVNYDGFIVSNKLNQVRLPVYEITSALPGQKPEYQIKDYKNHPMQYGTYTNDLYADNRGIELLVQTSKIRSIATSFDFSTALINTYYYDKSTGVDGPYENRPADKPGYYGVYQRGHRRGQTIKSTLSSVHHISKIGLLVTIRAEGFWNDEETTYGNPQNAIGYYDEQLNYFEIPAKERFDPKWDHLRSGNFNATYRKISTPKIYANLHLRVSKEINRNYRFTFFANNFLNIQPQYYFLDANGRQVFIHLNQTPAFGAEVVLKF